MTIKHISQLHANQYQFKPKTFKQKTLVLDFIYLTTSVILGAIVFQNTHVDHSLNSPITTAQAFELAARPQSNITPSPIPAPPAERDANIGLIKKIWGVDSETGVKIATCESGMRTEATYDNTNGTQDQGIFQVNTVHNMSDMFNATANISYAYTLFLKQGVAPWTSSQSCWKN